MTRRKKIFVVILVVLMGLVLNCFVFRGRILQWAFAKEQTHIHERYNARLTASSLQFSGFNEITIKDITLQPDGADTFMHVAEADVRISLVNLLRARFVFDQFRINGISLTIYNEEGRSNISFLRAIGRDKKAVTSPPSGYRQRAVDWGAKFSRMLHTPVEAIDTRILYVDSSATESVTIPIFRCGPNGFSATLINLKNSDTVSLQILSRRGEQTYSCSIEHRGNDTVYLPFLDRDRGLKCRFHKIEGAITLSDKSDSYIVSGGVSLEDIHVNHWRLAKEDVVLPRSEFDGKLTFTDSAVELDSSSTLRLGSAPCHLFARFDLQPDTTFTLGIHMPEIAADSFFASLPGGMFNTLKGISCSGTLAYDLDFSIHTNDPDSLLFYSALKQKGLHVRHLGADDYSRINSSFTYDAYDKDVLVRKLTVGPENPYFTNLDRMSRYLPQAVLQAEDPSFMQHRGFYLDAFRESIAKNYKEHRFARGGSTISMQLVKNVFLSRDKTISRKAEEAMIVYLIENLGLVPKERMLEVYLNVIEWGPDVYGIGEAAKFYFNKRPSELTLQESLFLASIIPRPKSFRYQFDKEGQLRSSMGDYFKILSERMVWRGVLEPSDTIGLEPKVTLKGFALHVVMPKDTSPAESEEPE